MTAEDFVYAKKAGCAIKLLAVSKKQGDTYCVMVAPAFVRKENPLYMVNDVFNAVCVEGNMLGASMFYGSGAGKLPTASAVAGDMVDAARHLGKIITTFWNPQKLELAPVGEMTHRFFVRMKSDAKDAKVFGDVEMIDAKIKGEIGFMTPVMSEDAFARKKLPYNLDAEKSVIGSMLMDRDAIVEASDMLTKEDFYYGQYGILFENMVELFKEGKAVDLVTLKNKLEENNVPDEVISTKSIAEILETVPTSVNAKHYAEIVADKSILRKMIKLCEEVEKDCYLDSEGVEQLLEQAESGVFNLIKERNGSSKFVGIDRIVMNVIEQIEEASRKNTRVTGIPTGFIDLDNMLTGLHGSEFILVAARPAMGKTAFVLNIAHHVAVRKGIATAIFNLEMSKEQLVTRMIAMDSLVDSQKVQTGQLAEDDWDQVLASAESIAAAPLYIEDSSALTISELRSKCRQLKSKNNLGLIIIDYLQLMSTTGRVESRQQFVSDMSRSLKMLARELDVPIIALSQLNREVDKRPDHKPVLADLRESGSIEQDADVVMFIYRDDYYNPDTDKKGISEIIIAKQRKGATGSVDLVWLQEYTKFANKEH